jgi:predicted NBD/HSP70 family sugar kinase
MRAALVDEAGALLLRRSVTTPKAGDVPSALLELVAEVAAERRHGQASHAVVGLPGAVDYEAGRLLWAPHLPERWPEQLAEAQLSTHLDLPVYVANDADLAAVGEVAFGAGRGGGDVAYVTISTGIGAGIVHGGRLLHGTRSLGEIGHTVIDRHARHEGRPCTLEELGSGSGLVRRARESDGRYTDASQIASAAMGGDTDAAAIWEDAVSACAVGVSNVVMAFSPRTVVIGGGLGRHERFFAALRERVLGQNSYHPPDLDVVASSLGDDAGLAGAAAWLDMARSTRGQKGSPG